MTDLWYYTKVGFLIGFAVVAVGAVAFAILLAPGFIAESRYGSPWGAIVGVPWTLTCIIALAVVITAAEDGAIQMSEPAP